VAVSGLSGSIAAAELDLRGAGLAAETELVRRAFGEIDDVLLAVPRAAIVDADADDGAVVEPADLDPGAEGQLPVGRGHRAGVEALSARGLLAVEAGAV